MGGSSSTGPSATPSTMTDLITALASGRLPNVDAVLWAREGQDAETGMRVVDVAPAGGIAVRMLPDRGLDLGQAWFAGHPLAWVSEVGEAPPIPVGELVDLVWGTVLAAAVSGITYWIGTSFVL